MSEAAQAPDPPCARGPHPEVCHFLEAPGSSAFDPVELARVTERVVCDGNRRKYSRFGHTYDYFKGVATGYVYGCCLRCVFCWASSARDSALREARLCSPEEVLEGILEVARRRRTTFARLSDGEPTIGREHLLQLLELVERDEYLTRFFVETNGVLLSDESYVRDLKPFKKVWVRVALKGGTPEGWSRKTGATPESFPLPFEALRHLKKHGLGLSVAAMSLDPRFMGIHERVMLVSELARVDPQMVIDLNEEMVVPYGISLERLRSAGYPMKRYIPIPVLWRFLQVGYHPLRRIGKKRISWSRTWNAIKGLITGT